MANRISLLAIAALLSLPVSGTSQEAGEHDDGTGIGYGVETDFASRYVFRGIAYSPGPVNQSTASLTVAGVTAYAWANVLLMQDPQQQTLSELDFGASYARSWKSLTLEGGLDGYVYRYRPEAWLTPPSTAEASVRLARASGGTSVFTKQIVDVASYPGAYYGEAGISHERRLSRRATVNVALGLGWGSAEFNRAYVGIARPALNLVAFEASLAHASSERLTLKPHVEVSYVCDARLRRRLSSGLLVSAGLSARMGR